MITENDLKKMKELDIVRLLKDPNTSRKDYNLACEFLLKRYENMIHKHWWTLQKQMGRSDLVNAIKDEYYSRAYNAFLTVINKIDLNRVYDEKFKIMQLFSWYLTNVRTTLIKETLRKSRVKSIYSSSQFREDEMVSVDRDVEEAYYDLEGYTMDPAYALEIAESEENCDRAVKACMKRWSDIEKKIFALLLQHKKKAEISQILNMKASKVYTEIIKMKKELKVELGVEIN